jgi:hypothetical protein
MFCICMCTQALKYNDFEAEYTQCYQLYEVFNLSFLSKLDWTTAS